LKADIQAKEFTNTLPY